MSAEEPLVGERLASFTVPSEEGNERLALTMLNQAMAGRGLDRASRDRLQTAVAEATMNAIEHGNHGDAAVPVEIEVFQAPSELLISISDLGGAEASARSEEPDLDRKLDGQQTPRGWGLFLIRNMVDDMRVITDGRRHTVWLTMRTARPPES
jgi:anti-sigma regulatory factor (Ser/Thr protein kinase)